MTEEQKIRNLGYCIKILIEIIDDLNKKYLINDDHLKKLEKASNILKLILND